MKKIILACGLLGILGAFSVGCSGNKCEEYTDKAVAKYESCGLTVETGEEAASGEATCTEAQAKDAECLMPCVDLTPCECIDPDKIAAGECTEDKSKDFTECVAKCAG